MADLLMKQLIAVIDNRTTMICLRAAGQIVPVDEPFDTLMGLIDAPPFHVHCRSVVAPWMPGFVSEIRKEANAEIANRPEKQKRFGPDGYGGKLPPPAPKPISPPSAPSYLPWTNEQFDAAAVAARAAMSEADKLAHGRYLMAGASMNATLRTGKVVGEWDDIQQWIDEFDGTFKRATQTMGSGTVLHRVIAESATFKPGDAWATGERWVEAGWSSTATDPGPIATWVGQATKWTVEIHAPAGTRWVPGLEGGLREVILDRNQAFDIVSMDAETRHVVMEVVLDG